MLRYFEVSWIMLKYFELCWNIWCILRYFEVFGSLCLMLTYFLTMVLFITDENFEIAWNVWRLNVSNCADSLGKSSINFSQNTLPSHCDPKPDPTPSVLISLTPVCKPVGHGLWLWDPKGPPVFPSPDDVDPPKSTVENCSPQKPQWNLFVCHCTVRYRPLCKHWRTQWRHRSVIF